MAQWYVSSVKYNAVAAYQNTHAYNVGDFIRATAPSANNLHVFRCTTAGTSGGSEPSWNVSAENNTTTAGTAVFTVVTGQSTYGWSAAAGNLATLDNTGTMTTPWASAGGDTIFLDSAHAQTQASAVTIKAVSTVTNNPNNLISVNSAGSVPPVAGDYLAGASIATTGNNSITIGSGNGQYFGIVLNSGGSIVLNFSDFYPLALRGCLLWLNNSLTTSFINNNDPVRMIWDNTQVKFGNAAQGIKQVNTQAWELDWKNTASAIASGSTLPTYLFIPGTSSVFNVFVHGVDLSALGSGQTLVNIGASNTPLCHITFYQCKLGASVVVGSSVTAGVVSTGYGPVVETIDCNSGAGVVSERHCAAGDLTTETSVTRVGGASTFGSGFSHKMQGSFNVNPSAYFLHSFPMFIPNAAVGSSRTITVEVLDNIAQTVTLSPWDINGGITLSNGNLTATWTSGSSYHGMRATPSSVTSGKYYWEVTGTTVHNFTDIGMSLLTYSLASEIFNTGSFSYESNGTFYIEGSSSGSIGSYTSGDVLSFAVDIGGGLVWARKNSGNWNNNPAANPATGAGGFNIATLVGKGPLTVAASLQNSSDQLTFNFGATAFSFTAPAGFSSYGTAQRGALQTNELYLDVDYINASGTPDGRVATTEPTTPLTAASTIGTSVATWNSPPASSIARKVQVSFTPQRAGVLRAQLRMAGIGKQIWVDPVPQLT
jgi:hypothetical protein